MGTSAKVHYTTLVALGGYSSTEVANPFKWIDGKIIYKKTINFGALRAL